MKRPTIVDIARQAGVSKAAVSYALNGQPGVSEATRQRILDAAGQLGWRPSSAARALSIDRAGAVGMVIARPLSLLSMEPYFMRLVAGVEQTLSRHGIPLLLTVTGDPGTEIDTYRAWWAERRVDGVLVNDLRVRDARLPVLRELGVPAVLIGGPDGTPGLATLRQDDTGLARQAVEHLAGLDHRRIAHVQGPSHLTHLRRRARSLVTAGRAVLDADPVIARADLTDTGGVAAARALLDSADPPTAMVFDNDVMAVAVVAAADELGVRIPADLAVFAWDDSLLCRLVHPAVTAFRSDISADGAAGAQLLLDLIADGTAEDRRQSPRELVVRGSTDSSAR